MDLLEIRTQFVKESGRSDLANPGGSDNGANFYINSGMKYLDRKIDMPKSVGRVFRIVPIGTYNVVFTLCRAINEVWASSATTMSRWQLEKKSIQDFRAGYASMWSQISNGLPLHYTPAFFRVIPTIEKLGMNNFEGIIGFADVMLSKSHEYNGVLFAPPTDSELQIEVWGKFYTDPMVDETDENYWSMIHPDLLVAAACRQLEVFSRNRQGREDWEAAIDQMLLDIDKDTVDEDLSEVDQMEG